MSDENTAMKPGALCMKACAIHVMAASFGVRAASKHSSVIVESGPFSSTIAE